LAITSTQRMAKTLRSPMRIAVCGSNDGQSG
jgi:hypothetical protein